MNTLANPIKEHESWYLYFWNENENLMGSYISYKNSSKYVHSIL